MIYIFFRPSWRRRSMTFNAAAIALVIAIYLLICVGTALLTQYVVGFWFNPIPFLLALIIALIPEEGA